MGARVKFLNVSDAVLKYVLSVGEEEKEIIEKTVKITALDLMISAADFSATEGDEITIPSASVIARNRGRNRKRKNFGAISRRTSGCARR